ncbi:hypothetical protein QTP88_017189 [Uroleucon formosanum]
MFAQVLSAEILRPALAHHIAADVQCYTDSTLLQTVLAVLMMSRSGTDAVPAEGLTPFGFLMARAYGQPAVNPIMRHITFKPSDGAKFRKSFEKKHGPRGRDLIDSLGRGSYRTGEATAVNRLQNAADIEIVDEASSKSLCTFIVHMPTNVKTNSTTYDFDEDRLPKPKFEKIRISKLSSYFTHSENEEVYIVVETAIDLNKANPEQIQRVRVVDGLTIDYVVLT